MSSSSNFNLAYNKQDVVAGGALSNATPTTTTGGGGGSGVTLINTAGSVNGITLTGGPITATGTISLGGTLGGIANSQLNNSSVTVTAGTGLSGGGAVSLGGTTTLTNSGVTSVAGAGTVSVSASTGNVTITGSGFSNPMTTLGDTIYGASTGTATRLAGNTATRRQYHAQTGTGSASAAPVWVNGPNYNVKDYGALGDGSTNDTTAIQAAITAAANVSTAFLAACVYFPSGVYCTTGLTVPNSNGSSASYKLVLKGDGAQASTITYYSSASGTTPFITWNTSGSSNMPDAAMIDLGFYANGNRNPNCPMFIAYGVTNFWMINIFSFCVYDSFYLVGGNLIATNLYVITGGTARSAMGCCLHAVCGVQLDNCTFYSSNGSGTYSQGTPPVWIQNCNSNLITNCNFAGTGSLGTYTPTSVTGSGTAITVTIPSGATNYFSKGEFIILYGFTPSAYNGYWRITNIVSNVITATCTATGTVTAMGTAYTMPCGVLLDNAAGPVNEGNIDNCLFSNSSVGAPYSMSAALYANGKSTTSTIEGWIVSNCYFDSGIVGIFLGGGGPSAINITTFRWSINNCTCASNGSNGLSNGIGMFWLEKCPGIQISNCQGTNAGKSTNSVGVYAYSDGNVPLCDGLTITGCYLGATSDFYTTSTVTTYGITLDGKINIFMMSNCIVWGLTAPTQNLNSALTSSSYVGGGGNIYLQGSSYPPTKVTTPTYFP